MKDGDLFTWDDSGTIVGAKPGSPDARRYVHFDLPSDVAPIKPKQMPQSAINALTMNAAMNDDSGDVTALLSHIAWLEERLEWVAMYGVEVSP